MERLVENDLDKPEKERLVHQLTKRNKREEMHLDHNVTVSLSNKCNSDSNECIVMVTSLSRRLTRNFVEKILPPGLLVVISWVRKNECSQFDWID